MVCSWNTHKHIKPKKCCKFHYSGVDKIFFHPVVNIFTLDIICEYVWISWNSGCTTVSVHTPHEKFIRTFYSPYETERNAKFVHQRFSNHHIENSLKYCIEPLVYRYIRNISGLGPDFCIYYDWYLILLLKNKDKNRE